MDETTNVPAQQHLQAPAVVNTINPFRRGDRVRLNPRARGKWPKRADAVGYVTEDPGQYMVAVAWLVLCGDEDPREAEAIYRRSIAKGDPLPGMDLFHFAWLEPAPIESAPGAS